MRNRTGMWAVFNALLMLLLLLGIASCGGGNGSPTPNPNGQRPTITGIAPSSGNVGDRIVITGLNFGSLQGSSRASMGGVDFTVNSWSDTQIDVTILSGMASGLIEVIVNGLVSQSGSQAQLFIPTRPGSTPILNTLNPNFGRIGLDKITLIGEHLGASSAGKVFFTAAGDTTVEANVVTEDIGGTTVTQWSDTSIVVFVPATAVTGPVYVQSGSESSNSLSFTALPAPVGLNDPTISAVTSNDVNIGIGSVVSIAGMYFGNQQGGSTITINGLNMQVINWSDTKIDAMIPEGATTSPITLSVGGKTVISDPVAIGNRPHISGLSPSQIKIGEPLTIFGTFFGPSQGAGKLRIGTKDVPVATWTNDTITVTAMVPVTADGQGKLAVTVTADNGLESDPFTATLSTNLKGSMTVSPTAGVVGVTEFGFLVDVSGGSDHYSYQLVSDKGVGTAETSTASNPLKYKYKATQLGAATQKSFNTAVIVTDTDTQETLTIDGPSVLVVAATQPVVTKISVGNFNRGVDAPNDWVYVSNGPDTLYHAFTFFQNTTTFASDMFEIINLGQPVPKFNRDESAYKFDGAMPRGLGYRYNTSLGAETSAGSIVHLDGLNFGVAQGSVEIAAGTPGAVTIGAADFVDWQDNFVEFRLPGDLNADLSGKVKVITATSKEFTTTDNLVCSAYISGVVPATNADPGGTVGFSGFDFGPPTKAGEIGSSIYIFWVINCSYTNPFTFANENGLALVTTPFAPDTVTSNLITFDMSRLDNVNVEVFNASGTASAIVPATQLGGSDYFAFLWTGAISPFTAGSSTVANSGVFSQAVTVNVGTGGGGPLTADFSADTTSGSGPLDVTFTYDALGGTGPYTFEIDYDGDSVTDDTFNTPGQVTHTYAIQPGPYNATLKVTDSAAPPATNTSPVIAITVTP